MSDLIKHLRNDADSLEQVRRSLRRPREFYNTLYFPNNNDVRLCPKNACSSIKTLYIYLYKIYPDEQLRDRRVGKNLGIRKRQAAFKRQDLTEAIVKNENKYQFRSQSNRIAIVRDPVERALSAVKYLYRYELNNISPSYKQIVDTLNEFTLRDNSHFFSQTHYMGYYDQYDNVYTMEEVNKLIEFLLLEASKVTTDKSSVDRHDVEKYPFYIMNESLSQITADDLPDSTVERIKQLYDMDYQNGWY